MIKRKRSYRISQSYRFRIIISVIIIAVFFCALPILSTLDLETISPFSNTGQKERDGLEFNKPVVESDSPTTLPIGQDSVTDDGGVSDSYNEPDPVPDRPVLGADGSTSGVISDSYDEQTALVQPHAIDHPRFQELLSMFNLTFDDYHALDAKNQMLMVECLDLADAYASGQLGGEGGGELLIDILKQLSPELLGRLSPDLAALLAEQAHSTCNECGISHDQPLLEPDDPPLDEDPAVDAGDLSPGTRSRSGTTPSVTGYSDSSSTNLNLNQQWYVSADNTAQIRWVQTYIAGLGWTTHWISGTWDQDSGWLQRTYNYPGTSIGCGDKIEQVRVRWRGRYWNTEHHIVSQSDSCATSWLGSCPGGCSCCSGISHCSKSCGACYQSGTFWGIPIYTRNCYCSGWYWAAGWTTDGYWQTSTIWTNTIFYEDVITPATPSPTTSPSTWTRDPVTITGYEVNDNSIVPASAYCTGVGGYQYIYYNSWTSTWGTLVSARYIPALILNPTNNLATGVYTVYMRAFDNAVTSGGAWNRNYGGWGTTTMMIDNTVPDPPTITESDCGGIYLTSPPSADSHFPAYCNTDKTPTFSWAAPYDYGSGVSKVQYRLWQVPRWQYGTGADMEAHKVSGFETFRDIPGSSGAVTWEYTENGGLFDHFNNINTYGQRYFFEFRTMDNVGWTSSSVFVTIAIDYENTAPTNHGYTASYSINEDEALDYDDTFDLTIGPTGNWDLDDHEYWESYTQYGITLNDKYDGIFFDQDPTEPQLTYSYTYSNSAQFGPNPPWNRQYITVKYDPESQNVRFESNTANWYSQYGPESITFTATDHHPQGAGSHTITFDITVNEVNDNPYVKLQYPPDGGLVDTLQPTLTWEGKDVDILDPTLHYNVYINKTPMGPGYQSSADYNISLLSQPKDRVLSLNLADQGITLEEKTLYYWKVVVKDSRGGVYDDAVPWGFSTPLTPKPDLAILSVEPRSVIDGVPVDFIVAIQNVGAVDIYEVSHPTYDHAPIKVEFALDGEAPETRQIVEGIPVNGIVYLEWSHDALALGAHTLTVTLDTGDDIQEYIEWKDDGGGVLPGTNNMKTHAVEIIRTPYHQSPSFIPGIAVVLLSLLGVAGMVTAGQRQLKKRGRRSRRRRLKGSDEGVSPVIGAVLIIGITIILSGTVFVYVNSYLTTEKTDIPKLAGQVEIDEATGNFKVVITGVEGKVANVNSVDYQLIKADGLPYGSVQRVDTIYWKSIAPESGNIISFADQDQDGNIDENDYFIIDKGAINGGVLRLTFSSGDTILSVDLE